MRQQIRVAVVPAACVRDSGKDANRTAAERKRAQNVAAHLDRWAGACITTLLRCEGDSRITVAAAVVQYIYIYNTVAARFVAIEDWCICTVAA